MPAALARSPRPERDQEPVAAPSLDAARLQAMAAEFAAQPAADPRNRRGPFRPQRLISARLRRSGALAVRFFRAADLLVLSVLSIATAGAAIGWDLFSAPLRSVLPFAAAVIATGWLLKGLELYRFGRNEKLELHLAKLTGVFAAAALPVAALALIAGTSARVGVGVAIYFLLALMSLHTLHVWWWSAVRGWRTSGKLTPNVVIVGATKHAERLITAALARRDVNVIGVFDDRLARSPHALAGVPVLGDTQALLEHRITPFVDRVVVAVDPGARTRVREIVERLRVLPNEVSLLVDIETDGDRDAALAKLADAPLTRVSGLPEDDKRAFSKRIQDIVIGSLASAALLPVMGIVALVVKLDSKGPVFFRQQRHGFNNETITVWKFRTMHHDMADASAERQVTAGDVRVTRVGKFLRQMSLDELPQLLNVLKGEMSLVGPRPHAVGMKTGQAESSRLVAEYAWRHRIKPGMTGWAAIKGSRGPMHTPQDVRRRVALDIEYIERQSFWFDVYCLAMTVPCLLGDRLATR
jgi:Undecaprenyl-phosphate glucose phosphotransferase